MKIFTGIVISKKMQGTATVSVTRTVVHPIYKKRFKRTRRYHVHDEISVKVGDLVKFVPSKPYSKIIKWKILEIVSEKGEGGKGRSKPSSKKA